VAEGTPFGLRFRTNRGCYYYDSNTGRIISLTEAMYDVLDVFPGLPEEDAVLSLQCRYSPEQVMTAYRCVASLADRYHVFSTARLKQRMAPTPLAAIRSQVLDSRPQLTLEVTDRCNLRCRYCVFSGGYSHRRPHGTVDMTWETASAAIELYFSIGESNPEGYWVSFYGGEPLLNIGLIQKAIDSAKREGDARGRPVRFNLTTNGTLLDERAVDCLSANSVGLLVSLDGDAANHDRNRVRPGGRGTHGTVMSMLEHLRRAQPDYYAGMVRFNCVLTPASDLDALNRFFTGNPGLFAGHDITVSSVSPGNEEFLRSTSRDAQQDADRQALEAAYIDTRLGLAEHDLGFMTPLLEKRLLYVHKRMMRETPVESEAISPSCLACARRLFVSVDGRLHVCERIGQELPVGDVRSGIDWESVSRIDRAFVDLMNGEDCRSCWAFRLCSACYAVLAEGNRLTAEAKRNYCEGQRRSVAEALATYVAAAERDANVWSYMDSILLR
jgi:uncharacterized protein